MPPRDLLAHAEDFVPLQLAEPSLPNEFASGERGDQTLVVVAFEEALADRLPLRPSELAVAEAGETVH